jgi:arsenite-transporting ATPase
VRVILLTGKGGVGKTTLAAATALRAAQQGLRVALLSSDPAHSLGDALGCRLGPSLAVVAPGVEAQEIGVLSELERSWETLHAWLAPLLLEEGGVAAEEVLVLPGFEELVALRAIAAVDQAGVHDLCVVDCAPTAATLRMLRLPEVLDLSMERFWKWKRRAARALRALAAPVGAGRFVAPDEVFDAFECLVAEVGSVRDILLDRDRASARLVTQPARVVVQETRRAHAYLALHGIATDALLINRILPDEAGSTFARWREREREALDDIEQSFALPGLRVPMYATEPRGIESLTALGEQLYPDVDAAAQLAPAAALCFDSQPGGVRLSFALPHADAAELDVARHGDDLEISLGLARRRISLPDSVAAQELESARLEDGRLTISFSDSPGR